MKRWRAVLLAAFLGAPQFAFSQDQAGVAALTPVAWVLIALLTVCGTTLMVLAAGWRAAKKALTRNGGSGD